MQNRSLPVFFSLAYLISWVIWLPLYLPAFGVHVLPVLPYHHALGGFGPMLAAFITTAVFEKKGGVLSLAKSMIQWRPILFVFIALFSPFLLAFLSAGICYITGGQIPDMSGLGISKEFPCFTALTFFGYNLLFFGFGEETGWRGFVLPRLQSKYNALISSVLLTLFWALWHWPLFFYRPGYTSMDAAGIIGWIASLLTGSVLLTWLFNSTRGSILACAIFHSTVDIAFTSDFSNAQIVQYMGMLITVWGILTIFVFKPRDLSHIPRVTIS